MEANKSKGHVYPIDMGKPQQTVERMEPTSLAANRTKPIPAFAIGVVICVAVTIVLVAFVVFIVPRFRNYCGTDTRIPEPSQIPALVKEMTTGMPPSTNARSTTTSTSTTWTSSMNPTSTTAKTKTTRTQTTSTSMNPTSTTEDGSNEVRVDLDNNGNITGTIPGVTVHSKMTGLRSGKPCSRQAVLKVTFSKLNFYEGVCWPGVYDQQQMLKVDMFFSDQERSKWMFDIGDSKSNNGWAGDGGDSDFAAEVQGLGTTITSYSNTRQPETVCNAQMLATFPNSLSSEVTKVTVYVANHYLKVTNDDGLDNATCSKCLYGLNGQSDKRARGTADQHIYVAANRVISSNGRSGYGLCSVNLRWVASPDQ